MKKKEIKKVLKTIQAICGRMDYCSKEGAHSGSYCPFVDDKHGHCILLNVVPEQWTKKHVNDMAYYISEVLKDENKVNE